MQSPGSSPEIPPEIGLFDSGVGGLSVLRELRILLPDARLHYLADAAYAPYGSRSAPEIRERSLLISEHLIACGARLVVVACNTATAHAIDALRARWPSVLFVGTEPGIKPAVAASRNGRIGVLVTPATAGSARLQALIERHAGATRVILQACPGVVDHIEAGDLNSPELARLVNQLCAPLVAAGIDTALLGCTHFPFIVPLWQQALGAQVELLRIETAVARQATRLWSGAGGPPGIVVETSGSAQALADWMARVMQWRDLPVRQWPAKQHNGQRALTDGVVPGTGLEPVRPSRGGRF